MSPLFYSGLVATEDPFGSELGPGGVPTMALCQATSVLWVYISIAAVTAT